MSESESSYLHHRSSAGTDVAVIVVAVDGHPESRDAAVLAATIADVAKADVMLVAVHPGSPVVLPREMGWVGVHQRAADMVHELHDSLLPDAGTVIESDQSAARELESVAALEHRDLLMVGSSSKAPLGRVRIDNRTRQLLEQAHCAVAIAPRGLSAGAAQKLRVIGVAYNGEPEAREALELAASLARSAGAKLRVEGVLDDGLPGGRNVPADAVRRGVWDELLESSVESLREDAELVSAAAGVATDVTVALGAPADLLLALSEAVDLLVIGSRRSGIADQAHLARTARTLLDDGRCPIIVVPGVVTRPPSSKAEPPGQSAR
jgi:nucleotide-binding universal stress UspA family protein